MADFTDNRWTDPNSLAQQLGTRLNPLFLLPAFGMLLLCVLWGATFFLLSEERTGALHRSAAESEALAQIFEERTTRVLRQVDQTSQFIKFEFEQHRHTFKLSDLVARKGMLPTDVAFNIFVTDNDGVVVQGNHAFAPTNFFDRQHFKVHKEQYSDQLFISQPIFGRISERWIIVISRRLNNLDGSFAGTVVFSIDQAYFINIFGASALGQNGLISVIGDDGVFRARRIGNRIFLGDDVNYSSWLKKLQKQAKPAALMDDVPFEGGRRLVTYRKLSGFPLATIIGMSESDALVSFHDEQGRYYKGATAASIFIVLCVAFLMLQSYRTRRSELAAQDARAIFRAAADGSLDAFCILRSQRNNDDKITDFVFTEINQRAARFLCLRKPQIIEQGICHLLPFVQALGLFDKYVAVAESGRPAEVEFEISVPEIKARWIHQQIIAVDGGIAITMRDITERKQAEVETRNNRAFLQSLIDYLPVMIYARSTKGEKSGQLIVWNKAAENMTGYPVNEVLGRTVRDVFPGDLGTQIEGIAEQMVLEPKVIDIAEVPLSRMDGGKVFLHTISVPLFDNNQNVEYILGIAEDITKRRQDELTLRTQDAELKAASDASPLGLFLTAQGGECTYVNRTYEEMSGLGREQAMGNGWIEAIHPEDRIKVFQAWRHSSRQQQPYQEVYRFRHSDGRVVWVSSKTAPIIVDGELRGYAGTVDDITARRAAEQTLRENESRLRTITDTLPAMVAYVDTEERYRFINIAFERRFGMRRDDMHGKPVSEVLGPAMYARVAQYIERVLQGEKVIFELEETDDGNYYCAEITYIPQHSEDGRQVVGFHVMNHDITSKKLEEKRLVQLAQIDSLTGLMNRAGFLQQLSDVMAHSKATGALIAVMYLDIDKFKQINDTYGHPTGDALLKAFVERLAKTLRSSDTVARLGGDEFTVIMDKLLKADDAATVAEKIVQSAQYPFLLEEATLSVTVSIGLAFYQGGDSDRKVLIRQADEMLYLAKRAGRNTYRIAPFELADSASVTS